MFTYKKTKRLLKRFIVSFALLLLLNVCILIILGFNQTKQKSARDTLDATVTSLEENKGNLALTPKTKRLIKSNHLWLMVLDEKGQDILHYQKPASIPNQYTLTDVARFSRFYLKDYPVFSQIIDDKLVVVGFPKNRIFRFPANYYESSDLKYFSIAALVLLSFNILYFIGLYLYSMRVITKKVSPIAKAILELPQGSYQVLDNQDEFQELTQALNQADQELKANDSFKEEWIAGVAHDIKTPLSVIISNASLAKQKSANPDSDKHLNPILVESYYIQNVLNDLNIFARLTRKEFHLQRQDCRIVPFFKEIIIQIINQEIWENFQFDFDYDQSLADKNMTVEKNLISRVLHNLIYNSVLHNPKGCQISVSLKDYGTHFDVSVRDNGVGVSQDKLTHLYEQEKLQMDITGIRRHGMGLKISQHIIETHQGSLRLDSKKDEFFQATFSLPFTSK